MEEQMKTFQRVYDKFKSKEPKFPHTVTLELWPEKPITQTVKSYDEWCGLMNQTLGNLGKDLADYEPSVAITTVEGSDRTDIVVTPPKEIIEEANAIN